MNAALHAQIDHLVVVADSLEQGAQWCEALFGLPPGPGGRHAFMGTHNRLLNVQSGAFPRCYLEIIAIDPQAPGPVGPRWFGMDTPELRQAVRLQPQLVQAVVRCSHLPQALQRLVAMGVDAGKPVAAGRDTPQGRLSWQIALRADGRLACGGACPTLIQWGATHPTDAMPDSGLSLLHAAHGGLPAGALCIEGVAARAEPGWACTLAGPRGQATLQAFRGWSTDSP